KHDKTRDIAFVKLELRRSQAEMGTARRRLKRKFGNDETVADLDVSGSRMEDEEIVKIAEAGNDTDSDSDDGGNSSDLLEVGESSANRNSFTMIVGELENAMDADDSDSNI